MLEKFSTVKAFIFDIDGVLSDGKVLLLPDGTQARNMNVKDGYALQLAVKKGYHVGIISGGSSKEAYNRLKGLGIQDIHLSAFDKLDTLKEIVHTYNLSYDEILYMGDDIPDYEVLSQVGVPCAPANAAEEIKQVANYVSPYAGGEGCVRDVIEKVMKLQNKWFEPSSSTSESFKW